MTHHLGMSQEGHVDCTRLAHSHCIFTHSLTHLLLTMNSLTSHLSDPAWIHSPLIHNGLTCLSLTYLSLSPLTYSVDSLTLLSLAMDSTLTLTQWNRLFTMYSLTLTRSHSVTHKSFSDTQLSLSLMMPALTHSPTCYSFSAFTHTHLTRLLTDLLTTFSLHRSHPITHTTYSLPHSFSSFHLPASPSSMSSSSLTLKSPCSPLFLSDPYFNFLLSSLFTFPSS